VSTEPIWWMSGKQKGRASMERLVHSIFGLVFAAGGLLALLAMAGE
jgi:hypothetical protein